MQIANSLSSSSPLSFHLLLACGSGLPYCDVPLACYQLSSLQSMQAGRDGGRRKGALIEECTGSVGVALSERRAAFRRSPDSERKQTAEARDPCPSMPECLPQKPPQIKKQKKTNKEPGTLRRFWIKWDLVRQWRESWNSKTFSIQSIRNAETIADYLPLRHPLNLWALCAADQTCLDVNRQDRLASSVFCRISKPTRSVRVLASSRLIPSC